jgi:hypothetical protein
MSLEAEKNQTRWRYETECGVKGELRSSAPEGRRESIEHLSGHASVRHDPICSSRQPVPLYCGVSFFHIETEPSATSFEAIGAEIGRLVQTKQAAYGDSFGKSGAVMAILYPEGIPAAKLDDALTVVRVLDKLFRIATDRDALGESPWGDITGYGLLAVKRDQDQRTGDRRR